jgi:N-acetylneuraminic acid mutarotase
MFGGDSTRNDTWTYDYATNKWQNMNPVNPPSARQIFGFVYGGSKIYWFLLISSG